MARRFRWTRKSYERAHHLARLVNRMQYLPDEPPALVQRYFDLWAEHERKCDYARDPLTESLDYRLSRFKGDDIPF